MNTLDFPLQLLRELSKSAVALQDTDCKGRTARLSYLILSSCTLQGLVRGRGVGSLMRPHRFRKLYMSPLWSQTAWRASVRPVEKTTNTCLYICLMLEELCTGTLLVCRPPEAGNCAPVRLLPRAGAEPATHNAAVANQIWVCVEFMVSWCCSRGGVGAAPPIEHSPMSPPFHASSQAPILTVAKQTQPYRMNSREL